MLVIKANDDDDGNDKEEKKIRFYADGRQAKAVYVARKLRHTHCHSMLEMPFN